MPHRAHQHVETLDGNQPARRKHRERLQSQTTTQILLSANRPRPKQQRIVGGRPHAGARPKCLRSVATQARKAIAQIRTGKHQLRPAATKAAGQTSAARQAREQEHVATMGVCAMAEIWRHGAGHQGRGYQPVGFNRVPPGCALCSQRCHARGEERGLKPRTRALSRSVSLQGLRCTAGVENLCSTPRGNSKHAHVVLALLAPRAGCDDLHRLSRGGEFTHVPTHERTRRVVKTARIRGADDADHVGGSSARGSDRDSRLERWRPTRAQRARASSKPSGPSTREMRMPERQAGP